MDGKQVSSHAASSGDGGGGDGFLRRIVKLLTSSELANFFTTFQGVLVLIGLIGGLVFVSAAATTRPWEDGLTTIRSDADPLAPGGEPDPAEQSELPISDGEDTDGQEGTGDQEGTIDGEPDPTQAETQPEALAEPAEGDGSGAAESSTDGDGASSNPDPGPALSADRFSLDQYRSACAALRPNEVPAGGDLQTDDDGCPVLANSIAVPFRTDQWTLNLTQNQQIAFTLQSNVRWANFTITAPDGTLLNETQSDDDFNGRITAPTTGTYTINLENPDYTNTNYTLNLYDITAPVQETSNVNPTTFNCSGGPIIPTQTPANATIQVNDEGCPELTNSIPVPFRTDQWTLNLTQNQQIAFTLQSNVRWANFTITAPDGTLLNETQRDDDFNGRITAPTTGTYTINLENPDYTNTNYTLNLYNL